MSRTSRLVVFCWGVWLLAQLAPQQVFAQETNRAGLVVVHGDGAAISRCVEFDGDSISGYELLAQSGLDLNVEASGMGATICRLDGQGCNAPRESCFCQCQGGNECLYWSYWQQTDGAWRYSNLGAGNSQVAPGAVEGWVWGDGQAQSGARLTELTFADICPATANEPPGTPIEVAIHTDSSAALAQPATASSAPPKNGDAESGDSTSAFIFFLVLAPVPILGAAYWLWRRKGAA